MTARDPSTGRFMKGGGGGDGEQVGKLYVILGGSARGFQRMMKSALSITKQVTKYMMVATAGAAAFSVREFAKFDQAMTESTSIMVGLTKEQSSQMRNLALEMSKTAKQGPDELAKSYFFLASAGMNAEQAMAALPTVTAFATAGAFDMAQATDLLTDAQSALGMTSKDTAVNMKEMGRLSDVLVKANTLANSSVEQFSMALTAKAGSALKVYNKEVEEGVAVLAAYADQGVKANLAGENLNRVMLLLSKSAIDNKAAHEKYGLSVFDSTGKMRNMGDIVKQLEVITADMSDETRGAALAQMGFAARVQGAILPLLGSSEAIKNYEKELKNAGGTTQDIADEQMKSFSNQMLTVWNTVKVAGVQIGEVLAPYIQKLALSFKGAVDNIDGFIQWLDHAMKAVEWFFTNWSTWIDYGVNFWILQFAKVFNDFIYFFTDILPAYVKIMPKAFMEMFNSIINNATNFGKALIAAIKGEGWNFVFEGFSSEFEKELSKLPGIGDRKLTDFERMQQKHLDGLATKMGNSWNEIFNPKKEMEEETGGDGGSIFDPLMGMFDAAKGTVMGFFNSIRGETASLREFLGANDAVRAGSADYYNLLGETKAAVEGSGASVGQSLTARASSAVKTGANKVWEEMKISLQALVEINQEQVDKPGIEDVVSDAGLTMME